VHVGIEDNELPVVAGPDQGEGRALSPVLRNASTCRGAEDEAERPAPGGALQQQERYRRRGAQRGEVDLGTRAGPDASLAAMERWSIDLYKEYFKFSAAHFLIFPDGSCERLHGHNYHVRVEIEARLSRHGLVLDFKQVKPVVRELVDELDEHWIVPGQHPELTCEQGPDGRSQVRYRDRLYVAPSEDVIVLPINNTSSENLAGWVGRQLCQRLARRFPGGLGHARGVCYCGRVVDQT